MKDGFQGQRSYRLPVPLLQEAATHPLCQGLFLTDIGFYPVAKAHKRSRRTGSTQYILLYCVQGSGWYQLNSAAKCTLRANQWVVLPADVPHKYAADDAVPWTIYWLHFTGQQPLTCMLIYWRIRPPGRSRSYPLKNEFGCLKPFSLSLRYQPHWPALFRPAPACHIYSCRCYPPPLRWPARQPSWIALRNPFSLCANT